MPLYLSRLLLNPSSRSVSKELLYPYEMHRTIMRAFPDAGLDTRGEARREHGILFRVDADRRDRAPTLYVQSRTLPVWDYLHERRDYLLQNGHTDPVACRDVQPVYERIPCGTRLAFRLRANPTRRISRGGEKFAGKRVEIVQEQALLSWLQRKAAADAAAATGFELVRSDEEVDDMSGWNLQIRTEGAIVHRKREGDTPRTMTHHAVVFDGVLRVLDARAFTGMLAAGFGSAKAFGFGLMTISPEHRM